MDVDAQVSSQGFCGVAVAEQCDGWHHSPCAGPSHSAEVGYHTYIRAYIHTYTRNIYIHSYTLKQILTCS